jgi:hypothetical protein
MLDLTSRTAFELHAEIQALKRAYASLKGRVRQLEQQQQRVQPAVITGRPRIKEIVRMVADMAGQSPIAIVGEQRDQDVVRARQVICWLARRFTRHSLTEVARVLDRDHTTVAAQREAHQCSGRSARLQPSRGYARGLGRALPQRRSLAAPMIRHPLFVWPNPDPDEDRGLARYRRIRPRLAELFIPHRIRRLNAGD